MSYSQFHADRITRYLNEQNANFYSKNMMGGHIFMVEEKMFCGIHFDKKRQTDLLMARIGEVAYEEALKKEGCQAMDFTGRPMRGYVFVTPNGFDLESDLEYWLGLCLAFNPIAKSGKKK